VREKLERMDRARLLRECTKLNRPFEQKMADEGLARDLEEWPEFCGATSCGPIGVRSWAVSRLGGDRS
jgi:hypothetical protein